MSSTPTSSLRLDKQGIGENDNTWGTKLNMDMDLLDEAIAGYTTVALIGSSQTLSTSDFASDEARHAMLEFTGALVSAISVIIPGVSKTYDIRNRTTGGFNTTVRQSGGSGFAVPPGTNVRLFTDGVTVVPAGFAVSADQPTIDAKIQAVGDVRYAQVSVSSSFTTPIFMVSAPLNEAKSFNITAAATIDLMGATGNLVYVSGETNIVSFGSAVAGTRREIIAATTVNLTNNNNTLLLQGRQNVILLPNDYVRAFALGSNVWIAPTIERRVKPAFSAYSATGQSIPANDAIVKVEFNQEVFDNNDNYSVANYRFTPSVPGRYQIDAQLGLNALNSSRYFSIHIYKNGVQFRSNYTRADGSVDAPVVAISSPVEMAIGDFVEIYCNQSDTFPQTLRSLANFSHFSAYLAD